MDILKYFYEEPASLEVLTPDLDPDARRHALPSQPLGAWFDGPRYYRGYLAGTNLDTGHVGVTALAHPNAFVDPLLDGLGDTRWMRRTLDGRVEILDDEASRNLLLDPQETATLACAERLLSEADVAAVTGVGRRYTIPALHRLLTTLSCVVFFPEPAHHGHDWSFFAARPMRDTLIEAFRKDPRTGVRRFVAPFQRTRSEPSFYFESWQLDQPLPDYIIEV